MVGGSDLTERLGGIETSVPKTPTGVAMLGGGGVAGGGKGGRPRVEPTRTLEDMLGLELGRGRGRLAGDDGLIDPADTADTGVVVPGKLVGSDTTDSAGWRVGLKQV